jgi:uncharacterized hydrophobic protein (TIGR00271 family)
VASRFTRVILPAAQRRTGEELTNDLDLTSGDVRSKKSAYWTMLVLSSVVASAGVLSGSTAMVIGAMIIAPLSTPIMGVALGLARGVRGATMTSIWFVLGGLVLVITVGTLFSLVMPGTFDLASNEEIIGRTSPGLMDLIAAIATGFAGAIALARRDVAAVLPGVAIAISLVPPLAVVGVCLGQNAYALATGAFLLFASNLLALVLAGTLVFTGTGYGVDLSPGRGSRRRLRLTVSLVFAIVALPLVLNTAVNYALAVLTARVHTVAESWVSQVDGASVTDVAFSGRSIEIDIRTPGEVPETEDLLRDLSGRIPAGIPVVVLTSVGNTIDAGVVGRTAGSD